MSIPFFHIDAFTSEVFSGNPAGVCFLGGWLDDATLQAIAAENCLPETAFLVRKREGESGAEAAEYEIRWFSPTMEIDLCGHATLAAAHAIVQSVDPGATVISFNSPGGKLMVTREDDLLVLDFPSRPPEPCEPSFIDTVERILGERPVELLRSRDLLAVYETEEQVRSLAPDLVAVARLEFLGVIVTAPGIGSDFVSRFFAPAAGIPEDPVTGSAHCTLIPYWSKRLGKEELHALQVSQRGGEIFCRDRGLRVSIGGRAVTYLSGTIGLPLG